jgi:hypothetical protein
MSLDAAASEAGSPVRNDPKAMAMVCAVCVALLISPRAQGQGGSEKIWYGANPEAGHYLCVDDAKIYYETYGSGGTPLVLLHGGLYGYIAEFGELIGELSEHRRVIALNKLELHHIKAEPVIYLGRSAVRLTDAGAQGLDDAGRFAVVDLVPGQWTHVKIQVVGSRARLYVNGAEQSTLIVNGLKQPAVNAAIALWGRARHHRSFFGPCGYTLTVSIVNLPVAIARTGWFFPFALPWGVASTAGYGMMTTRQRCARSQASSISARGTCSVSMDSLPLAACAIICWKASTRILGGGMPAVPRIVSAVLRSTAARSEIVGPADSPT